MIDHELEFSIGNNRNIEKVLVIRILEFLLVHSIMANISPTKSGVHLSLYPYHHHKLFMRNLTYKLTICYCMHGEYDTFSKMRFIKSLAIDRLSSGKAFRNLDASSLLFFILQNTQKHSSSKDMDNS